MRMGAKYTATVKTQVYAGWKCPHCGETNFSWGDITCKSVVTTISNIESKQEKARIEAMRQVEAKWHNEALDIIFDPRKNPLNMRDSLSIQDPECTNCGKKPKWVKGMRGRTILLLSLVPAVIGAGFAFYYQKPNLTSWMVLASFLLALVIYIVVLIVYTKSIRKMPAEYLPVIGSLDKNLILMAALHGKKLPSREEVTQLAGKTNAVYGADISVETEELNKADETVSASDDQR